jgi:hypothetical protein
MGSDTHIEMETAFMALTLDVVSTYAFGSSFGLLEKPGFSPEWKEALKAIIEAGILNRHMPWMAYAMMNLPDSVAGAISRPVAHFLKLQKEVKLLVEATLLENPSEAKREHPTLFQELRDSDSPPMEKTVERLMDEGLILIGAGVKLLPKHWQS